MSLISIKEAAINIEGVVLRNRIKPVSICLQNSCYIVTLVLPTLIFKCVKKYHDFLVVVAIEVIRQTFPQNKVEFSTYISTTGQGLNTINSREACN